MYSTPSSTDSGNSGCGRQSSSSSHYRFSTTPSSSNHNNNNDATVRFLRRQVAPTLRALCIMCAIMYSMNGMQSFHSWTTDPSTNTMSDDLSNTPLSQFTTLSQQQQRQRQGGRQQQMLRLGVTQLQVESFKTDSDAAERGFLNAKVANLIPQIANPETNKDVRETLLEALAHAVQETHSQANTKDLGSTTIHKDKSKHSNQKDGEVVEGEVQEREEVKSQKKLKKRNATNDKNDTSKSNKDTKAGRDGEVDVSNADVYTSKNQDISPMTTATKTTTSNNYTISTAEFVKHPGVVIATKVHGPESYEFGMLEQSLCLLHYAYNHRVLYDIVVFTTLPIPDEQVQSLQKLLLPAKLFVVVDNDGIENEIANLPKHKHDDLLKRCNVTNSTGLHWGSTCEGLASHQQERLSYNWQAEFRSLRVWHHPAVSSYRYLLWFDADAFCTKPWERDPVAFAIDKQAVILFDHFPQGASKAWIQNRFFDAFASRLCKIWITDEGNFGTKTRSDGNCNQMGVPNIHGFFHITDMDFYRSDKVQKAIDTLFGHCFLCRFPDDQLTVTAPAAMLAPERSFEMRTTMGTRLDVFHNHKLDGIDQCLPSGFKKYWPEVASKTLPAADGVCPIIAGA